MAFLLFFLYDSNRAHTFYAILLKWDSFIWIPFVGWSKILCMVDIFKKCLAIKQEVAGSQHFSAINVWSYIPHLNQTFFDQLFLVLQGTVQIFVLR